MGQQDGWDWLNLQEATIQSQRKRDQSRLSEAENQALWEEELAVKDERVRELEELRRQRTAPAVAPAQGDWLAGLGPELYPSEFKDRLRAALSDIVARGVDQGWDGRSLALFGRVVEGLAPSAALADLRQALRQATQDNRKVGKEVPKLLQKLGYGLKSDNWPAAGFVDTKIRS